MKTLYTSVFFVAILSASTSYAEDLMQVYAMSVKTDPQLLAEAASKRATSELDDQAKANFLPQVDLSATDGRVKQDTSAQSFGGKQDYNSHSYSLSITQPIFRKENFVQQTQADIAIEAAEASYLVKEQELIIRVAEDYFDLLGKQDDLSFSIAEREAIELQLEQTNQRFDVGMVTITDVAESQAAYDLANASVIDAENEVANSKERLRETSGHYVEGLATLNDKSPLVSPDPEDINQWTEVALVQNPSLLVAHHNVETARQEIALQKSDHYQAWIW